MRRASARSSHDAMDATACEKILSTSSWSGLGSTTRIHGKKQSHETKREAACATWTSAIAAETPEVVEEQAKWNVAKTERLREGTNVAMRGGNLPWKLAMQSQERIYDTPRLISVMQTRWNEWPCRFNSKSVAMTRTSFDGAKRKVLVTVNLLKPFIYGNMLREVLEITHLQRLGSKAR